MAPRMVLLGLVVLLTGCRTINAHHDYDPQAPFESYKTFAWVTEEPLIRPQAGTLPGGDAANPLLDPVIRAAVERNLTAKGYEQTRDPANADLVVSFSVGSRDRINVNSVPVTAGYRFGRTWMSGSSTRVNTYTEGILALDFFDGNTKQAVWHGFATKRLPRSEPSAERRREMVDQVTDAILARFPARGAPPAPAE